MPKTPINPTDVFYRTLIKQEQAISEFSRSFDERNILEIVQILYYGSAGRMIYFSGVGKSGDIAAKIASTFTSTGTPAIFLCPLQALHGGLGAIVWGDIIVFLSKSGETEELLDMLPYLQSQAVTIITITGNADSTLAKNSQKIIPYLADECCGTGFIPTTSTTLSLAIGDALAMALMFKAEFKVEQFARFHPGGSLGKAVFDSIGEVEFYGRRVETDI